jgi:hypothetical protein
LAHYKGFLTPATNSHNYMRNPAVSPLGKRELLTVFLPETSSEEIASKPKCTLEEYFSTFPVPRAPPQNYLILFD